ncbi:MAG: hypothetical protein ACMZ7B_04695 [Balneola sp.]
MNKLLPKIFVLAIIDFIIIWFWVKNIDPSPDVSIYIIILLPYVIGINLLIAAVLYFLKKDLVKLFLINSIISAIFMYYLFGEGVDRYLNQNYEKWEFQKGDTTFSIGHWKESNSFIFLESTDPNVSIGFLYGDYIFSSDQILLRTDSTQYKIKNGFLFGFRKDSIKLSKVKW